MFAKHGGGWTSTRVEKKKEFLCFKEMRKCTNCFLLLFLKVYASSPSRLVAYTCRRGVADAHAVPAARPEGELPERGGRPVPHHSLRGRAADREGHQHRDVWRGAGARALLRLLREDQRGAQSAEPEQPSGARCGARTFPRKKKFNYQFFFSKISI